MEVIPQQVSSHNNIDYIRFVVWPAAITLAVTAARLAGELAGGPRALFSPNGGGFGFSLVGIVWLVPVFGIYFALKLAAEGHGPKSAKLAVQCAVLGIICIIVVGLGSLGILISSPYLKTGLILWALVAAAAALQLLAWPALARTLFAYALAARLPVAILMFFAMLGKWGTHYDAVPAGFPEAGFAFKYLWFGLLPQMVFWVGFTVIVGALFGSAVVGLKKTQPPSPPEPTF